MLSRDSEDKMWCDLCLNLWYDLKKLLWQDELNPRVRCAFGNVYYIDGGVILFGFVSELPKVVTSDVDCLSTADIYQIKPSDLKFYWTFFHRGQKIVLEGPKAFKRIQNGPKWSIAGTSAVSAPLGNRYKESFLFSTYFNIFQHILP